LFQRLAIVGVGLLGGSVAKAARARGVARQLVGIGRAASRLEPALRDGTLDHVTTDLAEGLCGADLVLLAAPVATLERLLSEVWAAAAPEALVTDVGSTKAAIVREAQRLAARRPLAFVGSHPMAGSEKAGYAVARRDLFEGATVIVTPTDATEPRHAKSVSVFWEALGAGRVLMLDPEVHDRAVAAISHLPHLVAYALVDAVTRQDPAAFEIAARGFRDTTRIAASDAAMWEEIFLTNRTALAASLREFQAALAELLRLIDTGDGRGLREALERIKTQREALR
jgi:prephenate dehydrogenase